jgi:hypothetical protein
MASYTIIRVYEVPAGDRSEATERMLDALSLHVERDFHVADYIRSPEDKPGKGRPVDLRPAAGWFTLLKEQLGLDTKSRMSKK